MLSAYLHYRLLIQLSALEDWCLTCCLHSYLKGDDTIVSIEGCRCFANVANILVLLCLSYQYWDEKQTCGG